jgi:hypothetical protein
MWFFVAGGLQGAGEEPRRAAEGEWRLGRGGQILTYTVCEPSHDETKLATRSRGLKIITTYEVAGVPSGGGSRRGLATLHAGLDGSRPVEQAGWGTRRRAGGYNKVISNGPNPTDPEKGNEDVINGDQVAGEQRKRNEGR